jgi:hypothetical protein
MYGRDHSSEGQLHVCPKAAYKPFMKSFKTLNDLLNIQLKPNPQMACHNLPFGGYCSMKYPSNGM